MRITSRAKTISFFITLGSCLVAVTVYLNISWIVHSWPNVVTLVLGIIFFGLIIAGLVLYTIFLVREIRRNEQQDSFLNAVTHEL
jgi:two-component system sensor histidine kinase SenX3